MGSTWGSGCIEGEGGRSCPQAPVADGGLVLCIVSAAYLRASLFIPRQGQRKGSSFYKKMLNW